RPPPATPPSTSRCWSAAKRSTRRSGHSRTTEALPASTAVGGSVAAVTGEVRLLVVVLVGQTVELPPGQLPACNGFGSLRAARLADKEQHRTASTVVVRTHAVLADLPSM